MTKFSGITPLTTPALTDFFLGVTSGNVDFRTTMANLITFLNTNGPYFWQELGRSTLAVAGDSMAIPVTSSKYMTVLIYALATGSIQPALRFNADSGNNYAYQIGASNAGAFAGTVSTGQIALIGAITGNFFAYVDAVNLTAQEKQVTWIGNERGTAGAANAPNERRGIGKWVNTANPVTEVDVINLGTGDFAIGSEAVVIGHN